MMTIKYNTPIEVNKNQFIIIRKKYGNVCAYRQETETGKYYIKLWYMSYSEKIIDVLLKNLI